MSGLYSSVPPAAIKTSSWVLRSRTKKAITLVTAHCNNLQRMVIGIAADLRNLLTAMSIGGTVRQRTGQEIPRQPVESQVYGQA